MKFINIGPRQTGKTLHALGLWLLDPVKSIFVTLDVNHAKAIKSKLDLDPDFTDRRIVSYRQFMDSNFLRGIRFECSHIIMDEFYFIDEFIRTAVYKQYRNNPVLKDADVSVFSTMPKKVNATALVHIKRLKELGMSTDFIEDLLNKNHHWLIYDFLTDLDSKIVTTTVDTQDFYKTSKEEVSKERWELEYLNDWIY